MSGADPWDALVTMEQVVGLHAKALAQSGGMSTPPRDGCIEGSLGAAWNAEQYVAQDDTAARTGLVFAGYLLFYLVKNHCFGDGNKRAALASMHAVLSHLGLTVEVTEDDLVAFIENVATGEVGRGEAVVNWIAPRLTELR